MNVKFNNIITEVHMNRLKERFAQVKSIKYCEKCWDNYGFLCDGT